MTSKRRRGHGSRRFETSREDKILFPDPGITKGDLIDYYERVAEVMLPHVRRRIVTMRRFPDGIEESGFYQKSVPDYFPDWIETIEVDKEEGSLRQMTVEHAATLAYLAGQGCVEFHVWPSRSDAPRLPDRLIFDLDPSGEEFDPVRRAARATRDVLAEIGLAAFLMTTGSRGLHVVSPLRRGAGFDATRDLAFRIARVIVRRDPGGFTVEQRKNKRRGRVFIDCLRNSYAQHGVSPYSLRALPGGPVATPLDWDELNDSNLHPQRYTLRNLFRRLGRRDDPWKGLGRRAASPERARRRLEALVEKVDAA